MLMYINLFSETAFHGLFGFIFKKILYFYIFFNFYLLFFTFRIRINIDGNLNELRSLQMNLKTIKRIENEIFSLDSNERTFLFKRISVRMSPYMPLQGPAVTFFSPVRDRNHKFDVDLEQEITSALDEWEKAPSLPVRETE